MDDPFQQQALGRANAACAAIFALFDRFQEDKQLSALFAAHAEAARVSLLHTSTPDIALAEFDKAVDNMQGRLSKIL